MMNNEATTDPLPGSSNSAGKQAVAQPATVPRFQRRQSERYFLETEYREAERTPTMEYPPGQSPWAESPDATRQSFGDDGIIPAPAVQVPGDEHEHEHEHADGEGWSAEQQQQQWQYQQQQPHHQQQRGGGGGSSEENRRPASSRYHNVQPPPHQRQHLPQYKLHAKIAGLERSDKKDPILRFDVHV